MNRPTSSTAQSMKYAVVGIDRQTFRPLYLMENGSLTENRSDAADLSKEAARSIARAPDLEQLRRLDALTIIAGPLGSAYYVLNEHTLGYVGFGVSPGWFGVLAVDVFKTSRDPFGAIPLDCTAKLRPATLGDFERFRVNAAGHLLP